MSAGARYGRLFWTCAVIGWALIVAGVAGALVQSRRSAPPELAGWILGLAVVHDGVVAPLTFAAGRAAARRLPAALRGWLTGTLAATLLVVAASLPIVSGLGERSDNPSHLPRSYGTGLAVVIGIVWFGSAVLLVVARRRLARHAHEPS